MKKRLQLDEIFAVVDAQLRANGFFCTPVVRGQKKPAIKDWTNTPFLAEAQRIELRSKHKYSNAGILAGTPLRTGRKFAFIDIDDPRLVEFVKQLFVPFIAGKRGAKGVTIFCQAELGLKSIKLRAPGARAPAVEVFVNSGMTVYAPSLHPSGNRYQVVGEHLADVQHETLPIINAERLSILVRVIRNKNTWDIVEGGATARGHLPMLALTSSGIATMTDDLESLARTLNALFAPGYDGNTRDETLGMLQSAKVKGLGASRQAQDYNPGAIGPIPLGYAEREFVFRHQATKEVMRRVAAHLVMPAGLLELAPKEFWESNYRKLTVKGAVSGIDYVGAADALIQACRSVGAIDVSHIRGIGVWPEGDSLKVNLGGELIDSASFIYTSPKPLFLTRGPIPTEAILEFLGKPNWVTSSSPEMLLGWAMASVICGVLPWRPHAGVTGPAQGGKSTILRGIGHILSPMAVIKEGISTEAGVRQSIGYDARPVILDELEPESSRDRARVERIIKLMRSSSSATGGVARGTPEGKAITFSTRAMFLVGAINLHRISAADTSRMMRFELAKIPDHAGRRSHSEVLELLRQLESVGPAFCQYAIDHAGDILTSRTTIHGMIPAAQERQADNLATVLAGYWVALNGHAISSQEAEGLVDKHLAAIDEQREGIELDDSTECLNALLGYTVQQVVESEGNDGTPRSHREPVLLGTVLARTVTGSDGDHGQDAQLLNQFGLRREDDGFLVANSHPGLRRVYRDTRWDGGLWSSALSRLDSARKMPQRRFADGVRSLATWIPSTHLPEPPPDSEGPGY